MKGHMKRGIVLGRSPSIRLPCSLSSQGATKREYGTVRGPKENRSRLLLQGLCGLRRRPRYRCRRDLCRRRCRCRRRRRRRRSPLCCRRCRFPRRCGRNGNGGGGRRLRSSGALPPPELGDDPSLRSAFLLLCRWKIQCVGNVADYGDHLKERKKLSRLKATDGIKLIDRKTGCRIHGKGAD